MFIRNFRGTFRFENCSSDTNKIWTRGANLRADMTLAGFDGFRIQRSDQSIIFLGDGSKDGKVPPGSLCMILHKDREVINAFDGAGSQATEEEVQQEVVAMSQTIIFRPGIDVTQAVLLPQVTWRRQEKTEMVGSWKAKVYDMHNVVVSIKSRRVPGTVTDNEFFAASNENQTESEELDEILTEDERKQLEVDLKLDSSEIYNENGDAIIGHCHSRYESRGIPIEDTNGYKNVENRQEKKGWFGGWRKREPKHETQRKIVPPRGSLSVDEKVSNLLKGSPSGTPIKPGGHSVEIVGSNDHKSGDRHRDSGKENEYKKGLRLVLWLSPNFPLQTEELLPLLDILANKVKAIRWLRELFTTKLPAGTFPVKVAIPVVPTIRVLVSFTKFEELQPIDKFATPPSSPTTMTHPTGSSWFQWIKAPYQRPSSSNNNCNKIEDVQDPFAVPKIMLGSQLKQRERRCKRREEQRRVRVGTI